MIGTLRAAVAAAVIFSAEYILFAGILYVAFWVIGKRRWRPRRSQERALSAGQHRREFALSISTMLVFGLLTTPIVFARSHTKFVREHQTPALFWSSLLILVLVNDAYFYWAHRLMHWGPLYRVTHAVHHRFTNPSPWAAFSFHPIEAAISYLWFPIFAFTVPVDVRAAALYPPLMILYTVFIHLGYDVSARSPLGRRVFFWLAVPSHHNRHHQDVRGNYGFYFILWDRLFGTVNSRALPSQTSRPDHLEGWS